MNTGIPRQCACGSFYLHMMVGPTGGKQVWCLDCLTEGPEHEAEADAWAAWNYMETGA